MKSIIVQSPTRVDLAGGTLDLWPLYSFLGGAQTINVAIDIYTRAQLDIRKDSQIIIESKDLNFKKEWKDFHSFLKDPRPEINLFKAVIDFWKPVSGFSLLTESQSPVGGGLGGSSSLTVSMMKCFQQMQKVNLSVHELVHICHNLEAQVLNTPTGTQDYYPAVSGGLNILTYSQKEISQKVISISQSPLKDYFLLVYTGKSHHSGINNFEVLKSAVGKDQKTMQALQKIQAISEETIQSCLKNQWHKIPDLFNQEFSARIQLTPAFSSPEIEKLQKISMQAGAQAVKICGAGGGGCVLLWVEPSRQTQVREACAKAGFHPMSARPLDPL